MKISELIRQSRVPKETIHFYIREGLLPKPRKLGKNVAEYDPVHLERLRIIKELQETQYLPLAVIKKILKRQKSDTVSRTLLRMRNDYFRPVDELLPGEIKGEEAFREATGLGRKWLKQLEDWEILTPEPINGEKVYSQDDITIGKLVVDMDRIGLGPKDDFDPEALSHYLKRFREIVVLAHKYFFEPTLGKLSPEEFSEKILKGREIMSIFFYHLYRKISRQEYRRLLELFEEDETERMKDEG